MIEKYVVEQVRFPFLHLGHSLQAQADRIADILKFGGGV